MWFFIIIATGIFVSASQFHPFFIMLGNTAAFLLAIISVIAVLFILLAATTGGSFELGGRETWLVFSFVLIAVFGFILPKTNKHTEPAMIEVDENE